MRLPFLLLPLLLSSSCGGSGGVGQPPGLTLPDGDRVVRVQPGTCEKDCILSDPVYESVTEVTGPERSDEQIGRELAASLAKSGWSEMHFTEQTHGGGDVHYPYAFRRTDGSGGSSYLLLFPAYPGTYGLAYDEDGDSLDAR